MKGVYSNDSGTGEPLRLPRFDELDVAPNIRSARSSCATPKDASAGPLDSRSIEEFVRLFSCSQHRVLRFIHTLVPNLPEAEDILQETSVVLWKKWPQFERDKDFVKWACGIARLEVFRTLRQRKRNGTYLSEVVLNQIADLAVAEACEYARFEAGESALELCMQKLLDADRQILALRYQQGLTVQQIAEKCARPKSSIHDQLQKLRIRLLRCVRRRLDN